MPGDLIYVILVLLLCHAERVVTMGGLRHRKRVFPKIQIRILFFFQNLFLKCNRTETVIPKGSTKKNLISNLVAIFHYFSQQNLNLNQQVTKSQAK